MCSLYPAGRPGFQCASRPIPVAQAILGQRIYSAPSKRSIRATSSASAVP